MALDLQVGDDQWRIGSAEVLHAFFSTISVRLEPHGWGTRFPALMNELYQGELEPARAETALSELLAARRELAMRPAAHVVWDADAPFASSPRWDAVAGGAPDLSRCFFSDDGRDLFDVLLAGLMRLRTYGAGALRIVDGVPAYYRALVTNT